MKRREEGLKTLRTVVIGVLIGTILIACANDTSNLPLETIYPSSMSEIIDEVPNPTLVAEAVTVKIKISTEEGEYISNGVLVGDGHFAVTYAPEISAASTKAEVRHIVSKVVTDGSIIYIDKIFGLALIRLTDYLGTSAVISQSIPNLGEELIIGALLPIQGEDLMTTRYITIAGFDFDGLVMRFNGIVGSGNSGGPVLNEKGQLVGIVAHQPREGVPGSLMSLDTFRYGLAAKLVKYNETVTDNGLKYDLDLIGIPAHVTKPLDWTILSGLGYFDIRAPEQSDSGKDQLSKGYKAIGIINANSSVEETLEEALNRAIFEFGDPFDRVREFVISDQHGLDKCVLLMTIEEYSHAALERRGHVIQGGWVSYPGIYTGLCTGISKGQRVVVFAESYDVDDIIHADSLYKKIALVP